jgi:hypothetical protein
MSYANLQASVQCFTDPESESDLKELDLILQSLDSTAVSETDLDALFGIFERFPEHDGFGVFWSIVHFLEACKEHEPALLRSVARKPVPFNLMMINRIINGGGGLSGKISLIRLLEQVRDDPSATESAQAAARDFIDYQLRPPATD